MLHPSGPFTHIDHSGMAGFEPARRLRINQAINPSRTGTGLSHALIMPLYHLSYIPHKFATGCRAGSALLQFTMSSNRSKALLYLLMTVSRSHQV